MGLNQRGTNNPNYGNKWTQEQKETASKTKTQQFKDDPNYAYECGKTNRGKKFSPELIESMHGNRTPDSYKRTFTEEVKQTIGKKSKEKFTEEYKQNQRKTMEERGLWVPLEDKDPYEIYYKESNWHGNMIRFFDDVAYANLNENGIFSRHNTKGWVRDHIVPRKIGYEFGLPPFIMRHPANMNFVSHSENVSKGFSDRVLTENQKTSIIDLLFERILNFSESWFEQDICVTYIKERRLV